MERSPTLIQPITLDPGPAEQLLLKSRRLTFGRHDRWIESDQDAAQCRDRVVVGHFVRHNVARFNHAIASS